MKKLILLLLLLIVACDVVPNKCNNVWDLGNGVIISVSGTVEKFNITDTNNNRVLNTEMCCSKSGICMTFADAHYPQR